MTAYAQSSGSLDAHAWQWEMRSLNARGLDLRLRVPDWIGGLEQLVRGVLQSALSRGSVSLTLKIERRAEENADLSAIDRALDRIAAIEARAAARGKVLAPCSALDVIAAQSRGEQSPVENTDALRDAVMEDLTRNLLPAALAMRAGEGHALHAILRDQLDTMEGIVARAAAEAEARHATVADQIRAAFDRITAGAESIDPHRLSQDLAAIGMKSDVTEEIDRLGVHIGAAHALLEDEGSVGRKFDFLMQEFNREANTLAAKSQDTALTATCLELKTVIERMREQVQNVE